MHIYCNYSRAFSRRAIHWLVCYYILCFYSYIFYSYIFSSFTIVCILSAPLTILIFDSRCVFGFVVVRQDEMRFGISSICLVCFLYLFVHFWAIALFAIYQCFYGENNGLLIYRPCPWCILILMEMCERPKFLHCSAIIYIYLFSECLPYSFRVSLPFFDHSRRIDRHLIEI